METIIHQIQVQNLLKIKKIIDKDKNGDKFIIVRTKKNIDFMREYNLNSAIKRLEEKIKETTDQTLQIKYAEEIRKLRIGEK